MQQTVIGRRKLVGQPPRTLVTGPSFSPVGWRIDAQLQEMVPGNSLEIFLADVLEANQMV